MVIILAESEGCDRCSGSVEQAVRSAVDDLRGDLALNGMESALAESAYRLARSIDAGGDELDKQLAGLNRELRATLKELADLMPVRDDDGDEDTGPS